MRTIVAAFALLLVQTLASTAQDVPDRTGPEKFQIGTVSWLDPVGMSFSVWNADGSVRQYWATRFTRYSTGRVIDSFFGLERGELVTVSYHDSGPNEIADSVSY